MDIAVDLTPVNFSTDTEQMVDRIRFASQCQPNGKHLKDISNSLHAKLPHFKSKETGPKALSKGQDKENAMWVETDTEFLFITRTHYTSSLTWPNQMAQ